MQRKAMLAILRWSACVWILGSGLASAASFDCAKAATGIENAICANPFLSHLDAQLADVYAKALTGNDDKEGVATAQKNWLRTTRKDCADVKCLISVYERRIADLTASNKVAQSVAAPISANSEESKSDSIATPPQSIEPIANKEISTIASRRAKDKASFDEVYTFDFCYIDNITEKQKEYCSGNLRRYARRLAESYRSASHELFSLHLPQDIQKQQEEILYKDSNEFFTYPERSCPDLLEDCIDQKTTQLGDKLSKSAWNFSETYRKNKSDAWDAAESQQNLSIESYAERQSTVLLIAGVLIGGSSIACLVLLKKGVILKIQHGAVLLIFVFLVSAVANTMHHKIGIQSIPDSLNIGSDSVERSRLEYGGNFVNIGVKNLR